MRELLVLWPTNRCNLNCSYCYAKAEKQGKDMSWETAEGILEQWKHQRIKVQFAGGEPLLHQELIWKTAEYLREWNPGTVLQLQTNGTLLTGELAEKLREYRIQTGISLDGPPTVNEKQRGHTREVLRGIEYLQESGLTVGLNAVLTDQSADTLARLADLGLLYPNIRGIAVDLLRLCGRAEEQGAPKLPTSAQVEKSFRDLYERSKDIGRIRGIPLVLREVEEAKMRLLYPSKAGIHCYASLGRSFVFLPDGSCYPCGSLAGNRKFRICSREASSYPVLRGADSVSCAVCPWQSWCDRGCPAREFFNGTQGREAECTLRRTAFWLAKKEIEEK